MHYHHAWQGVMWLHRIVTSTAFLNDTMTSFDHFNVFTSTYYADCYTQHIAIFQSFELRVQKNNSNTKSPNSMQSNDVFQTEKSQVSIASITYPNRFKVLPMYLKSNIIRKIYLYSDQEVILGEMDIFISQNEDNSDLMKDVSEDMSLDPLI